jgi:hypothetical protein
MKALAYSVFGYGKTTPTNCFAIETYLRGCMVNCRFNRVIYPNWITVFNLDPPTYSHYRRIFDWLQNKGLAMLNIVDADEDPLTLKMLYRLKTVLSYTHPDWDFTHVLCRDVDSICTYREAQAVQQWIQENKAIHCITDSISHNIPMMGGMIGFKPADLGSRLNLNAEKAWKQLIDRGSDIDFRRKGADQDFLNREVYPKCAESATEHFVLGMRHNLPEVDGRHYSIPDVEVEGVDPIYKCTNDCSGHIGSAGYYEPPTLKFLNTIDPYRQEYAEIERQFPKLFFWRE